MPTDQRSLPAFLSTDADWRAWGGGLSAQLAVVGLVKAADTGQIDWTTVVKPTVVNTWAGYEIWRFNDSLQATKPVFIKIEYGIGSLVDRPILRITVCTATNGAGVPAGQISTVRTTPSTASKTAGVQLVSYCSGSPSRLNLCTNHDPSNTSYAMLVLIERTRTGAGVETGDGIVTFTLAGTTSGYQVVPFSGSIPGSANYNAAVPYDGQLSSVGVDIVLSPTTAMLGKPLFASWLAYRLAEIGELTPFTIDHLGATHTYMPLGDGVNGTYCAVQGGSSYSMAMLWE